MKNVKQIFLLLIAFISGNAGAQLWKEYSDSAATFKESKNYEKATEYYLKGLKILPADSAVTVSHTAINDSLGSLFIELQKFKNADSCYSVSRQIKKEIFGEKSVEYALGCYNLGFLYLRFLSRYKEAESLLQESKTIREKVLGKENLDYALSCHYLGVVVSNLGNLDEALSLYQEAKKIRDSILGPGNIESAKTYSNIGSLYYAKADYATAVTYYKEAAKTFSRIYNAQHFLVITTNQNIAGCYHYMGEYLKALNILLETKKNIFSSLGKKSRQYVDNCAFLGQVYREMGEFEKAENIFNEQKQMSEEIYGKETMPYAISCWNLGALYLKLGQNKKAEAYFLQSKNLREKIEGKKTMGYAACCEGLAEVYTNTGEYEKVESLLLESIKIRRDIGGDTFSNNQLGFFYLITGQNEKALTVLNEGKKVLERTNEIETEYYLSAIKNLANACLEANQADQARTLLLNSKKLIEKLYGKDNMEYARIYKNIAEFYWKQSKYDSAYSFFQSAIQLQTKKLREIFQFTSEPEKQAYQQMVSIFQNSFLSFNRKVANPKYQGLAYDAVFTNRNMILSSFKKLAQNVSVSNDTALIQKYNSWIAVRKQLSLWYTMPDNRRPTEMISFETNANRLEKELMGLISSTVDTNNPGNLSWELISQNLKTDEAAIEFAEFKNYDVQRITDSVYYIALLLRKNQVPQLIPLFEKKQLDSLVINKRTSAGQVGVNTMYTFQNAKEEAHKKNLYKEIWQPIEEKLTGINTIYFAPAGSLHKIAFAALPVSDKQVLSDKYRLIQLNTTASAGDNSPVIISASDKIILYGGVQYDADSTSIRNIALKYSSADVATRSLPDDLARDGVADFYYLSGTETEINAISKLADHNSHTRILSDGLQATEESFKELSGKNSPAILHIATHGFFFPDPKNKQDDKMGGAIVFRQSDNPLIRSGLALAGANNAWKGKPIAGVEDGILTAYEVSNMYLPNTKLAVLSACETGLGDIQGSEGVYGLQRAFKMAGVQNLVMSLWKVDDVATSEFMQEFYKNLFSKQTISDAFYNAQTVLKNRYRNDPYKWAAWVLIR